MESTNLEFASDVLIYCGCLLKIIEFMHVLTYHILLIVLCACLPYILSRTHNFPLHKWKEKFRSRCGIGFGCFLLVPAAILLCFDSYEIFLMMLAQVSLMFLPFKLRAIIAVASIFVVEYRHHPVFFLFSFSDIVAFYYFPKSFSFGEMVLLSHLLESFIFCLLSSLELLAVGLFDLSGAIFLLIVGCSSLLVVVGVPVAQSAVHPLSFYLVVVLVFCGFATPLSLRLLGEHVVTWIFRFTRAGTARTALFFYWSAVVAVAVAFCGVAARRNTFASRTSRRKVFHAISVLIFLPGICHDAYYTCVAATCALAVLLLVESLRLFAVWPIGRVIDESFQLLRDDRQDQGKVIFTHVYLLIGFVFPLWFSFRRINQFQKLRPVDVDLLSGVMALGVGDTAAALIGSRYGAHKWPGSSKSLEGTVACFASQLAFVYLLSHFGVLLVSARLVAAVAVVSVVESWTLQSDNLVLPILFFVLLQ